MPSTPVDDEKRFYVVSDVWMGRAEHYCETAEEAEQNQYELMRNQYQCEDEEDGKDEDKWGSDVQREQFRAWPADTWPHHLSFVKAFDWIGRQTQRA